MDRDVEDANLGLAQDEERIKKRYSGNLFGGIGIAAPTLMAAYYSDVKWTVAVGLVTIAIAIAGQDARFFDLATRTSRINSLLRDHMIVRTRR